MNENQFWGLIWKCATVAFVVAVATVGGCTMNKQRVLAQMVEQGADPIKAHCAIYMGDTGNHAMCAIAALPK